ncbi:hypothetical protein TWF281_009069 [Arthrobotrys megalospora]
MNAAADLPAQVLCPRYCILPLGEQSRSIPACVKDSSLQRHRNDQATPVHGTTRNAAAGRWIPSLAKGFVPHHVEFHWWEGEMGRDDREPVPEARKPSKRVVFLWHKHTCIQSIGAGDTTA